MHVYNHCIHACAHLQYAIDLGLELVEIGLAVYLTRVQENIAPSQMNGHNVLFLCAIIFQWWQPSTPLTVQDIASKHVPDTLEAGLGCQVAVGVAGLVNG